MDKPGFDESAAVAITGKIMVIAIIVLFLVVVFVLFLHLYAKWFWWRFEEQPTAPHPSRRNRRRFFFAPAQDTAHPLRAAGTKGLDPKILVSLPVLMFRHEEFKEGLECAVCLSELVEGEKARVLPKCSHGFHVDCIDMWFQSHSTCPLCRNPVSVELENPSPVLSGDEVINGGHNFQSPNESLGSGYNSEDSPCFPTNVLFWGDQTQVSSGGACLEEGGAPASSSGSGGSSSLPSGSGRQEGMLVIDVDVDMNVNENFSEEESKSPMPTRLRSLKRLLSREKKAAAPCSSSGSTSVDV